MGGLDNLNGVYKPMENAMQRSKVVPQISRAFIEITVHHQLFIDWKNIKNSNIVQLSFQQDIINRIIMFYMIQTSNTLDLPKSRNTCIT